MRPQGRRAASPVSFALVAAIMTLLGCAPDGGENIDANASADPPVGASSQTMERPSTLDSTLVGQTPTQADTGQPQGLRFGEFHLAMDPRALVARYPTSGHRMTMATSGRGWSYHEADDGDPDLALLWEQYTSGRGTYIIRVAAREAAELIYYVQLEFDRGAITEMRLSFGVPAQLRGRVETRSCESVMESLVEQYGPPMRELQPYSEALARHEPKIWFDEMTELRWDCAEFAIILRRL